MVWVSYRLQRRGQERCVDRYLCPQSAWGALDRAKDSVCSMLSMKKATSSASRTLRRRAPRKAAGERRAEILRTAMNAFAQKGYRESGTATIARKVGISEPTLYRYFASKRELYLEALELGTREILVTWKQIADQSASPLDALLALGAWYFEDLQRDASTLLLRARAELETDVPEVRAKLRDNFLETYAFIRELHSSAQRQGLLAAEVDLDAMTWFFMSLGSLIDRTQVLELRSHLGAKEIASIYAQFMPELLPHPPHTKRRGKSE